MVLFPPTNNEGAPTMTIAEALAEIVAELRRINDALAEQLAHEQDRRR